MAKQPILDLVSYGLQLWLRSQCEQLDHLQLDLEGTAAQLLRGRLAAARLHGRGIVWRLLRLSRATITCQDVRLDLRQLGPHQPLGLSTPLVVAMELWFSSADLQHTQLDGDGSTMGMLLLSHFRGLTTEESCGWRLQVMEDSLGLVPPDQSPEPPLLVQLRAMDQTIAAYADEAPHGPTTLPLDRAIRVHHVRVDGQYLYVRGEALVTPEG